ncbi:peptidylprolyl isomerase [Thiolapillus brandeum]|uniref:peptidylprolyl isomerase n=1 Tax=Thiolapillus brandeum TaxID=1076588 RepID=A0A7U6JH30_9GAMM|nr:peptidylprolyl isomerase [Thiolapillus brandeum]BAO43432.1 peptidyl-prolyl cis-trans isomerase C [Thiolapillus brandeum]
MSMRKTFVFALMLLPCFAFAFDDDGKVLIDGPEADLTLGELRQALLTVPEDVRGLILTQPQKIRNIMDSTYMVKVGAERALKKGLDKDPVLQAKLWNYRLNLLAAADVKDVQHRMIGNDVDYEAVAREQYLVQQDKFRKPAEYEASHILFTITKDGRNEEQQLAKLSRLREDIVKGKITFAEAAKKFSMDDGTASKGGSLGKFEEGRMVPAFEKALKHLKPGDISQPVKTRYGLHLILLQGKTEPKVRPFEEVKEQIIEEARKKAENDIKIDYWLKVKNDPKAKVDEQLFKSFMAKPVVLEKP